MINKRWNRNTCDFIRDFSTGYSMQISFKHQYPILTIKNCSRKKLEIRICHVGMSSGDFYKNFSLEIDEDKKLDIKEAVTCEIYWREVD